ncbi:calcium-binding protein [Sinorhizobium fredii]|uniref:Serralysin-like metalloprotease domain-containing protein n=1 Tax=Rhizobium fredii TaxID=380 RepID=A0A2L0H1K4_RHIFR|nr:calcium-binding protein [Sinorhizobium fredii]AUX75353.1 serralysin-like metalloprotease domain-containing protein [Sinorhizobium fredii]
MSKKVKSIAPPQAMLALDPLAAGYTIPGVGDQTVNGDGGSNFISTGSGSDTIDGGLGADTIKAGTGDDEILNQSPAGLLGDKIDGGLGFDVLGIDFSGSSKGVSFAAFDPIVTKAVLGATILNVERFELAGSNFADTFTGGRWNDWFEGGAGADVLNGGIGKDWLEGGAGSDRIYGGNGDDSVLGDAGDDYLSGGYGIDWLSADEGNDTLLGGAGGDYLYGHSGNDNIKGESGTDTISGGSGRDVIDGGSEDDYLAGDGDDDTVLGGAGNDTIRHSIESWASDGKDVLDGGVGYDEVELSGLSGTFTAKSSSTKQTLSNGTTIINFEAYTIYGSDTADWFTGWTGADTLSGKSGNDTLVGLGGNDHLDGGLGSDSLDGGEGNDLLIVGSGGKDTVKAGSGNDSVWIDRADIHSGLTFTVSGTTAKLSDGTVVTDGESFTIDTGNGSDVISAGTAAYLNVDAGSGNNRLTGGKGGDSFYSTSGSDTVSGGDGDDRIIDNGGGTNRLDGGNGNDYISAEAETGTALTIMLGAAGGDQLSVNYAGGSTAGRFSVDGGSGTDTLWISRYDSTKNLSFVLSANATLVNGDVTVKNVEVVNFISGQGHDTLTAGNLDDDLNGMGGNDTLKGLGGNDELTGWTGADKLYGGDGNDVLWGSGGIKDSNADSLYGEKGNDILNMNAGDYASGGDGFDRAVIEFGEETFDVSFVFGSGLVKVNANTSFTGMEALEYVGGSGKDTVTGSTQIDYLEGGLGNDALRGGGGNDYLIDGKGNDRLYGDAGNDTFDRFSDETGTDYFDGGSGVDTLEFDIVSDRAVIIDLENSAKNGGVATGLTLVSIENVVGQNKEDTILGNGVANTLKGGMGDDRLDGRAGNDKLEGGAHGDLLTGGSGADHFIYVTGDAIGSGDQITDFKRGEDKVVIDKDVFGFIALVLYSGNDLKATGTAAQFFFETDNGRLWYDADGTGNEADAVLMATLDKVTSLAATDFLLV